MSVFALSLLCAACLGGASSTPHPPPRIFAELRREGAELVLHVVAENTLWAHWMPGHSDATWFEPDDAQRVALEQAGFAWFDEHVTLTLNGEPTRPTTVSLVTALELVEAHDGYPISDFAVRYPIRDPLTKVGLGWTRFDGIETAGARMDLPSGPDDVVPDASVRLGGAEGSAEDERSDAAPFDPAGVPCFIAMDDSLTVRLTALEPNVQWWAPVDVAARRSVLEVGPPPEPSRVWAWAILGLGAALGLWWSRRPGLAVTAAVAGISASWWWVPTVAPLEAVEEAEGLVLFEQLHARLYDAYASHEDEEVYDTLASAVAGDLLDELHAQIVESLVLRDEGGAVSRVDDRVMEQTVWLGQGADDTEFVVDATWRLDLSVRHYGHVHQRTNRYRTQFVMGPRDQAWKVVAWNPIDAERVEEPDAR